MIESTTTPGPGHGVLFKTLVVAWCFFALGFTFYTVGPWGHHVPSVAGFWEWPRCPHHRHNNHKRNMIFMVSDGMGPASVAMARNFKQFVDGNEFYELNLDQHFLGQHRTKSASSLITDSAAGATAFACGVKTYNGAIGVDPSHLPVGSVLEAAKRAGYQTGMVVTTLITDATPAAFSAHVLDRSEQSEIASQLIGTDNMLGRTLDLMIGGGRGFFLPKSEQGFRNDTRILLEEAQQSGWNLVTTKSEFDQLKLGSNVTLPLLALLENGNMPFEIDREDNKHPALADSVRTAIKALSQATADSDKGFFLLIEGSRIDHAGHLNDPGAQVREVLAYDLAVKTAMDFAAESDVETVVISTSDHETGGLAVGRQVSERYPEYAWYPEILANAKHSTDYLAEKLREFKVKTIESRRKELAHFVESNIFGPEGLNLPEFSRKDVRRVIHNRHDAQDVLADLLSTQAQIGWSTHGHSAVDINVYGYAKDSRLLDSLRGNRENIKFADFMARYLEVDLEDVTKILRSKWDSSAAAQNTDADQSFDRYHQGLTFQG